jgi:hypothetical protein
MIDKIKKLVGSGEDGYRDYKNRNRNRVIFEYEVEYKFHVICKIIPISRNSDKIIGVRAYGDTQEIALDKAISLLEKFKSLDIDYRPVKEDCLPYRQYIDKKIIHNDNMYNVMWRLVDDEWFLTDITLTDEKDFYIFETPQDFIKCKVFEKFSEELNRKIFRGKLTLEDDFPKLKEGEEAYIYDDIGCLCGTAGLVVVKDGKMIKQKVLLMS